MSDHLAPYLFSCKAPAERVLLTFDFTKALASTETLLLETLTSQVVLTSGTDDTPAGIIGSSFNLDTTSKKAQVTAVGGNDLATYKITVFCTTTAGQLFACPGVLPVKTA